MASLHITLFQLAGDTARQQRVKAAALNDEIDALEAVLAAKKTDLQLAKGSVSRLDSYEPEIEGNRQCPFCWVAGELHSDLTPISSNTDEDLFRCKTCRAEIPIAP